MSRTQGTVCVADNACHILTRYYENSVRSKRLSSLAARIILIKRVTLILLSRSVLKLIRQKHVFEQNKTKSVFYI